MWWFLKTLNLELPYDPEISLLDIYPQELKAGIHINGHSNVTCNNQKIETIMSFGGWVVNKI